MEITWRDYKIKMNEYSWDLYRGRIHTQKAHDRMIAEGKTPSHKVGDVTGWIDLGFFTNMDTLLNKLMRYESGHSKSVLELHEFMDMWKGILSDMREELMVKAGEAAE